MASNANASPTQPSALSNKEFFDVVRKSRWNAFIQKCLRATRSPEGPSGEGRFTLVWTEIIRFLFPGFSVVVRKYHLDDDEPGSRDKEV